MENLIEYTQNSYDFKITVKPAYLPEKSSPEDNNYFFIYKIKIKNESAKPAKLISRHWIITDGRGRVEQVEGPGVVGEQPVIGAGEEFEYVSACPLSTPTGNMRGTYTMQALDGIKFKITIPVFFLRTEVYH
ncbi:MAG: Co2+/Mg2+ efflux protein ApaG [Oligoflexia bacterium]|nr:Co2+/Mg2+ efflux protein ApaG [Oligoflexia bacterium]